MSETHRRDGQRATIGPPAFQQLTMPTFDVDRRQRRQAFRADPRDDIAADQLAIVGPRCQRQIELGRLVHDVRNSPTVDLAGAT